jgi:hypothetical protein
MTADFPEFDLGSLEGDVKAEESKVEHAVVIVGEIDTRFIFGRGGIIESDKEAGLGSEEAGPTHLSPDEKGIWIWDGTPGWRSAHSGPYGDDDGGEPIYEGRGTWRRPTDEEALKIAKGDFSLFGDEVLYAKP